MFSNTANSSANDKVKTRPKWKAYFNFIPWFKNNQQKSALIIGYVLVAGLFFGLGKISSILHSPTVRIEEPALNLSEIYNNSKVGDTQSPETSGRVAGQTSVSDCAGKIKGNISSGGKIYHLPGGAFYDRTNPEICFDTEEEAQKAGFRKSSR